MFLKMKWILRNPFPVQIELTPQATTAPSPTHHETHEPGPVAGRVRPTTDTIAMTDTAPRAAPGATSTIETESTSEEVIERAEIGLAREDVVQRGDAPAAGGGKSKIASREPWTFIGLIRAGATPAEDQARMTLTTGATDVTGLELAVAMLTTERQDWPEGTAIETPLIAWLHTPTFRRRMTKNKPPRKTE